MIGAGSPKSSKPGPRKPLQVIRISRREQKQQNGTEGQVTADTKFIRPGDAMRTPLHLQGEAGDAQLSNVGQPEGGTSMTDQSASDILPLVDPLQATLAGTQNHSHTRIHSHDHGHDS